MRWRFTIQGLTLVAPFKDIARAHGLPPEVDLAEAQKVMSAGMLSYLKESWRLDNSKLMRELGVVLRYPNLEIGLVDSVEVAFKVQ